MQNWLIYTYILLNVRNLFFFLEAILFFLTNMPGNM